MARPYSICVTEQNEETLNAFKELADSLGVSVANLAFHAFKATIANPPKASEVEGTQRSSKGSANGFWVISSQEGIEVKEVANRSDASGRQFFRYKDGDEKQRNRALNQAKRAAALDATMLGIDEDDILVTEIEDEVEVEAE